MTAVKDMAPNSINKLIVWMFGVSSDSSCTDFIMCINVHDHGDHNNFSFPSYSSPCIEVWLAILSMINEKKESSLKIAFPNCFGIIGCFCVPSVSKGDSVQARSLWLEH